MRLTFLEANLACLGMFALDTVVRALRIRVLVRGTGEALRFRQAVEANLVGDAASAVTPFRFGGEPGRLGILLGHRVPAPAALAAAGAEVVVTWPVLAAAGLLLAWGFAPGWWREAGPGLVGALRGGWPWVVAVLAATVAAALLARRRLARRGRLGRSLARFRVYLRRMPPGALAVAAALSVANIALRVGVLVVLALSLAERPALGTLVFGSFVLVYGQLLLPTPAGAGPVELGFLAGAAGGFAGKAVPLLVAWRFHTLVLGAALGAGLAFRRFGRALLRRRGRR